MLIESQPGESLEQFREAVDDILTHIWGQPQPNWWHPYEIRGTYRLRGITFRQFFCVAGSVELHLLKRALQGLPRRIAILPDRSCVCVPKLVEDGNEVQIDPTELEAA